MNFSAARSLSASDFLRAISDSGFCKAVGACFDQGLRRGRQGANNAGLPGKAAGDEDAEAQAASEDLLQDVCLADLIVYVVRLCLNSLALWCILCNTEVSPATCRSIWQ